MSITPPLETSSYLKEMNDQADITSNENNYFFNIESINENSLGFFYDVISGLKTEQKTLPCKYFYDEKGSRLFEEICSTKEYYITRTELALLPKVAKHLHAYFDRGLTIIEPGCGAGEKVKILMSELNEVKCFVPLEISASALNYSVDSIENDFPDIDVKPLLGDFTEPKHLLELSNSIDNHNERLVFFPGSTIGNFERDSAISVLNNLSVIAGDNGYLLIGIDLLKNRQKLLGAYNDNMGVTEAFNKNILHRVNTELNADFNVDSGFNHLAIFNEDYDRIEMYLQSCCDQVVSISGHSFSFLEDECIHTENSHKYSVDSFCILIEEANLKLVEFWTDEDNCFGVFLLKNT